MSVDVLDNRFWIEREAERSALATGLRCSIVNTDSYWLPPNGDTAVEVAWEKARLDALEVVDQAILSRTPIDPKRFYFISNEATLKVFEGIDLPTSYTDIDGITVLPTMITDYNQSLMNAVLSRAGIVADGTTSGGAEVIS